MGNFEHTETVCNARKQDACLVLIAFPSFPLSHLCQREEIASIRLWSSRSCVLSCSLCLCLGQKEMMPLLSSAHTILGKLRMVHGLGFC